MSPLAVADTYGPELHWLPLDRDRLVGGLSSLAGRGSALAGELLDHLADDLDDESALETPPGRGGVIDAIAWTTREKAGVLAALGARFDMSFVAIDAGEMGLALTIQDPADRDRAFADGVWAMTDGIAMWRSGEEASAAFMDRRSAVVMTWRTPWLWVDPSKPGQVDQSGVPVSVLLRELVLDDGDPDAWVTRFRLDRDAADRLRALFRRGPYAAALRDLSEILGTHPSLLAVLSDGGESQPGSTVITARGLRQQFRDDMRSEVEATAPGLRSFRGRHPRIWLGFSVAAILGLTALALTGFYGGRATALVPGLVALIWTASLAIDGSVRRAIRGNSSKPVRAHDGPDH
jgi:hypothetical protein